MRVLALCAGVLLATLARATPPTQTTLSIASIEFVDAYGNSIPGTPAEDAAFTRVLDFTPTASSQLAGANPNAVSISEVSETLGISVTTHWLSFAAAHFGDPSALPAFMIGLVLNVAPQATVMASITAAVTGGNENGLVCTLLLQQPAVVSLGVEPTYFLCNGDLVADVYKTGAQDVDAMQTIVFSVSIDDNNAELDHNQFTAGTFALNMVPINRAGTVSLSTLQPGQGGVDVNGPLEASEANIIFTAGITSLPSVLKELCASTDVGNLGASGAIGMIPFEMGFNENYMSSSFRISTTNYLAGVIGVDPATTPITLGVLKSLSDNGGSAVPTVDQTLYGTATDNVDGNPNSATVTYSTATPGSHYTVVITTSVCETPQYFFLLNVFSIGQSTPPAKDLFGKFQLSDGDAQGIVSPLSSNMYVHIIGYDLPGSHSIDTSVEAEAIMNSFVFSAPVLSSDRTTFSFSVSFPLSISSDTNIAQQLMYVNVGAPPKALIAESTSSPTRYGYTFQEANMVDSSSNGYFCTNIPYNFATSSNWLGANLTGTAAGDTAPDRVFDAIFNAQNPNTYWTPKIVAPATTFSVQSYLAGVQNTNNAGDANREFVYYPLRLSTEAPYAPSSILTDLRITDNEDGTYTGEYIFSGTLNQIAECRKPDGSILEVGAEPDADTLPSLLVASVLDRGTIQYIWEVTASAIMPAGALSEHRLAMSTDEVEYPSATTTQRYAVNFNTQYDTIITATSGSSSLTHNSGVAARVPSVTQVSCNLCVEGGNPSISCATQNGVAPVLRALKIVLEIDISNAQSLDGSSGIAYGLLNTNSTAKPVDATNQAYLTADGTFDLLSIEYFGKVSIPQTDSSTLTVDRFYATYTTGCYNTIDENGAQLSNVFNSGTITGSAASVATTFDVVLTAWVPVLGTAGGRGWKTGYTESTMPTSDFLNFENSGDINFGVSISFIQTPVSGTLSTIQTLVPTLEVYPADPTCDATASPVVTICDPLIPERYKSLQGDTTYVFAMAVSTEAGALTASDTFFIEDVYALTQPGVDIASPWQGCLLSIASADCLGADRAAGGYCINADATGETVSYEWNEPTVGSASSGSAGATVTRNVPGNGRALVWDTFLSGLKDAQGAPCFTSDELKNNVYQVDDTTTISPSPISTSTTLISNYAALNLHDDSGNPVQGSVSACRAAATTAKHANLGGAEFYAHFSAWAFATGTACEWPLRMYDDMNPSDDPAAAAITTDMWDAFSVDATFLTAKIPTVFFVSGTIFEELAQPSPSRRVEQVFAMEAPRPPVGENLTLSAVLEYHRALRAPGPHGRALSAETQSQTIGSAAVVSGNVFMFGDDARVELSWDHHDVVDALILSLVVFLFITTTCALYPWWCCKTRAASCGAQCSASTCCSYVRGSWGAAKGASGAPIRATESRYTARDTRSLLSGAQRPYATRSMTVARR